MAWLAGRGLPPASRRAPPIQAPAHPAAADIRERNARRAAAGNKAPHASAQPLEGAAHIGPRTAAAAQFLIGIYGGYFGGGIGFLMPAALTLAGLPTRDAGATKNALAGVMNAAAVVLFATSPQVHWRPAIVLGTGAIVGGLAGTWALKRVNERALRIAVVCLGVALTIGLFVRPI